MTKNKSHKKKSLGWYLDLALNLILLFFGLVLVCVLLHSRSLLTRWSLPYLTEIIFW